MPNQRNIYARSTRSKFKNKKVTLECGTKFDSRKEARRYKEIKLLERAGVVKDLQLQVPFQIEVNGMSICKYVADFAYNEEGAQVVEDTKGFLTPEYKLKKKLMRACHGIEILET